MNQLSPEEIRALESDHSSIPETISKLKEGVDLLNLLRGFPERLSITRIPDSPIAEPRYRLVIKDPLLADCNPQIRQATAMLYSKGMEALMQEVLSTHPNIEGHIGIEAVMDAYTPTLFIIPTVEDGSRHLYSANPSEQWRMQLKHDPALIMGKFFAENGVNFPGSEKFIPRTAGDN